METPLGVDRKALGYPTPPTTDATGGPRTNSPEIGITRQVRWQVQFCQIRPVNAIFQVLWSFELMQICALACVKLGFIFFYRRIFCTGNGGKVFSAIAIAMIVIIIAWAVSFGISPLFICNEHFAAMWTSIKDLNTHCGRLLDWQLGYAISDFITDVMVLVLPLPCVTLHEFFFFFRFLHGIAQIVVSLSWPAYPRYGSFSYPPSADSQSLEYFFLALCEFGKKNRKIGITVLIEKKKRLRHR